MLAHLAGVYFQMGEGEKALATASEALQLAQQRTARVAEFHASIISAAALANHNKEAAERVFRRADELLKETGAYIFDPLLAQTRASLFPRAQPRSANGVKA